MRFFEILSSDPFIRFQRSITTLQALITKADKEIKSEHFREAKEEFKHIQGLLDKNIGRNTIVHLLEEEEKALGKLSSSEEKRKAEEEIEKAQNAIEAMISVLPEVIVVLERIEKQPEGYRERPDNPKVLGQWISQFEELVETLRLIAQVEEELFRKAERVGIKTEYDPRFKGKPVGYLSDTNMFFFVKGTPKQILYIYYVFVSVDTVRLTSGMDPKRDYFPKDIPLDDFYKMTKKVNIYEVQKLMAEKAIRVLSENKDAPFEEIKRQIKQEKDQIGWRIDYGNYSYIKIKMKEDIEERDDQFPKMQSFLKTIDEKEDILLVYNCRKRDEFENVGKFSMYKALNFLHVPVFTD